MKKRISIFFLSYFILFCAFSETYSLQQLIPSGHWLYDAIYALNMETKKTSFASNSPISVSEFKMYFDEIDYEKLSESGKSLYKKIQAYLDERKFGIKAKGVSFSFNAKLNPILMGKTNKDLDWSFATDFTGHKLASENLMMHENFKSYDKEYGAASSFMGNSSTKNFFEFPIYLDFGNILFFETVPMWGKNFWAMSDENNFSNLAYKNDALEFFQPFTAYGSVGKSFDSWGINFNVSRQGLQIGKTQTGSIIYNQTFQTDFYAQLNVYSPRVKYNLDVVEINKDRYMYIHMMEVRPYFDWLKISLLESTLIVSPFELRYLNPLMIIHSYGNWRWGEYSTEKEEENYGQSGVCAYLGVQLEINPAKHSRFYILYAQNELQLSYELNSEYGRSFPDSFGFQLGYELNIPSKQNGYWTGTIEGIYTSPFLYLKQGSEFSLYSRRYDMQKNGSVPICSWIGTPFGPDALGGEIRFCYTEPLKWACELDYLFLAHGTNSFGLFNNKININGDEYDAFYPTVLYKTELLSAKEAEDLARTYKLTGTVSYTNQIALKCSYRLNEHFNFSGKFVYSFVFNSKNMDGNFQHGAEFSIGAEYSLF